MAHRDEIGAAATSHNWVIRASSTNRIEMRRGSIDLSFNLRRDGQLATGSREDSTAPAGYRFTDHILKSTKNRLAKALQWITEEPAEPVTVDLDRHES